MGWAWGGKACVFKVCDSLACFNAGHAVKVQIAEEFILLDREVIIIWIGTGKKSGLVFFSVELPTNLASWILCPYF